MSRRGFDNLLRVTVLDLKQKGNEVPAGIWQGEDVSKRPDWATVELLDYHKTIIIPATKAEAVEMVEPDMPWAEDHFQERISGVPMNPGTAYKDWPWHTADPDRFLDPQGQFDVSYMERIWPRSLVKGIRFRAGDLDDVIVHMNKYPRTRQAVLPLFFPEDTGPELGRRTMCSMYYHFVVRDKLLNVFYDLRSCDFVRHFKNDIYLAMRMGQYVRTRLVEPCEMGLLFLQINSLHYHRGDEHRLRT